MREIIDELRHATRDERTFVTESWTLVLGKVVGGVSCDGPKRTKKDAPREERLMMRKGI